MPVIIGLPKVLTDVANDILISRDFLFFTSKIIQNPRQSKDGSFLANQLTCCYKSRVLLCLQLKSAAFSRKKPNYMGKLIFVRRKLLFFSITKPFLLDFNLPHFATSKINVVEKHLTEKTSFCCEKKARTLKDIWKCLENTVWIWKNNLPFMPHTIMLLWIFLYIYYVFQHFWQLD